MAPAWQGHDLSPFTIADMQRAIGDLTGERKHAVARNSQRRSRIQPHPGAGQRPQPVAGQPPDPPPRPMQFAIGQPPHRAGITGGVAQILPTRPMVSVRQTGQRFEPMTQGIALPGIRQLRKRRQFKRSQSQPGEFAGRAGLTQIHVRQLFEQPLRFSQMRRAAGHGRHRLWPALDQHGQDLMPKVIARVLPILVRGIFDPAQAMRTGISLQFSPRDIKQWPQ
ncbi:hypothetical protein D3C78_1219420 [compost metagenome]